MDKRRNHIIFWVCFFLYYYIMLYFLSEKSIDRGYLTKTLVFISAFKMSIGVFLSFYILNLYIFPSTLPFKKYIKLCFSLIVLWLLIFEIIYQGAVLLHILFPEDIPLPNLGKNISWTFKSLEHSLTLALVFWFSKVFIANAKYERFLQEQQNLLLNNILNAELLALKNQINPHFFYNMLNFFYAQFLPYSKNISNAILKLSDMMRYTIRDNSYHGKALLEDEINYLKSYIELENINRCSDKIFFSIEGNPNFRRIRPLIFQNILEHCRLFGDKIYLKIIIDDKYVVFSGYYIKKDDVNMSYIFKSIENIKQKLSSIKECDFKFNSKGVEHNFQMSVVS